MGANGNSWSKLGQAPTFQSLAGQEHGRTIPLADIWTAAAVVV
jgi:hypothetical protein